jgi:hypothetical protein
MAQHGHGLISIKDLGMEELLGKLSWLIMKETLCIPDKNKKAIKYWLVLIIRALNKLKLGELVPENKKARDFLAGIADPLCTLIKLTVLLSDLFYE